MSQATPMKEMASDVRIDLANLILLCDAVRLDGSDPVEVQQFRHMVAADFHAKAPQLAKRLHQLADMLVTGRS